MKPTRLFEFIEYQNQNAPLEKAFTTKYEGKWESISSQEFINQSRAISRALIGMGIKAGDKITINGTSLTVYADAAVDATSFFVEEITLDEALNINANIAIDEDNMFVQYQRKTEGTVAGFDIDADGMSKGGVEITGWLDSDTMEGATANNIPTAESVKAYVDASSGGTTPTLQEVTDAGNTTTNSIMIGSSSSPDKTLHVYNATVNEPIKIESGDSGAFAMFADNNTTGNNLIGATGNNLTFWTSSAEKMRITSAGNVLIATTTDSGYKLNVNGTGSFFGNIRSGGGTLWSDSNGGVQLGYSSSDATGYLTTYYNTTSVVIGAGVSQKTGITINGQSASVGNKISFRVGDSERMRLTSGGNLLLGTTTDDGYKLDVNGTQRVQDVLELDDVLTLNAISTPDDPAAGKSSIYMDSADGAIKVKINVGGTVVTRTIASFE